MAKQDFQGILRNCLTLLSRRTTAGFTLIELLVAALISSMVISGLLFLAVELLKTDKKEMALSKTQEEMAIALDYIESDLEQAVYVYEGRCLTGAGNPGQTNYCPGLSKVITFPAGVTPILAFWKLDEVPYSSDPKDQFPNPCSGDEATVDACNALKISRNTYTLVVYSLRTDNPSGETWEGPARLTRYQLRQYSDLSNMTPTSGWTDPTATGMSFQSWPRLAATGQLPSGYTALGAYSDDVLVDAVDLDTSPAKSPKPANFTDMDSTQTGKQPCPAGYSATPPDIVTSGGPNENSSSNSSFYACVRITAGGQSQDVFVFLRGRAIERAGLPPNNANPTYLPKLQAQVKTRTLFNYSPSDL